MGGSHRALYDLATGLDRSRYQPVVLFYQSNEFVERLQRNGIEVITYEDIMQRERRIYHERGRLRRTFEMAVSVKRRYNVLRRHRIDLVHFNNSPWYGCDDWSPAAKLLGIPVVSSAMGIPPEESAAEPVRAWLVRRLDRILPVSQLIADMWLDAGVRRNQIKVVHHGIDVRGVTARVRRTTAQVRRELQIPEGSLLVAMVGNVREWKGQHVVIEALHLLDPAVLERITLVFAGGESAEDKGYRRRLDEMIAQFGLHSRVRFLGFRNDVPDIMAASDIVVHASIQPEPGGIVVLEAMAFGAAIVAAARGGHTEVMIDGTGLVFDTERPQELAACLTRLTTDEELRARLGRAANERIRQFSLERNVAETQAVYDELLFG